MPYTLGVSSISERKCKRKRAIYIITRKNRVFFESSQNSYTILGTIIHNLIQSVLEEKIDYLEYFHFRQRSDLKKSITMVLEDTFQFFNFLLNQKKKYQLILKSDYNEVESQVKEQINIISEEMSKFLNIDETKKSITSKLLDDEFNVTYQILPQILLTGKIDLVGLNKTKKNVELTEIKTGNIPQVAGPRAQLKIYSEIFKKSKTTSIVRETKLFLWSTKKGNKDYSGKISDVSETQASELEKVKKEIIEFQDIKKGSFLPKSLNRAFTETCNYCEFEPICDDFNLGDLLRNGEKTEMFDDSSDITNFTFEFDAPEGYAKINNNVKFIDHYLKKPIKKEGTSN